MGFKDEYSKINSVKVTSKPTRSSQKATVSSPVQAFSARMNQKAQQMKVPQTQNISPIKNNWDSLSWQDKTKNTLNELIKGNSSDNSLAGVIKNSAKGVVPFMGDTYTKIGNQVIKHPLDTAGAITSGVYNGAIKPVAHLVNNVNPVGFLLPEQKKKISDAIDYVGSYKPKTQTGEDIQKGFDFGGAVAPYLVGGEIIGATKLGQAMPRLAQYLGFTGTSQLLSDKKITDVKGRAEQAGMDSLMFLLTGGLKKSPSKLNTELKKEPQLKDIPSTDTANIPSTKESPLYSDVPKNDLPYTPSTLQNGESVNGPTVSNFKQELAKLQNERLQASLATDRPRPQGYQSGIKFEAKPSTKLPQGESNPLIQEAKKYKSAEEFVKAKTNLSYQGDSSRSLNNKVKNEGLRASNIDTNITSKMIEDAKINKTYNDEYQNSINILNSDKNKVRIFRAAPVGSKINYKDYVALTENGAKKYMTKGTFDRTIRDDYEIISTLVDKKDLVQQGKNSVEFAYIPEKYESQLTDIWNKASSESTLPTQSTLISEAKKYKSAEEFVKAQEKNTIYRGQPTENKFRQSVSNVDASNNILIGKGVFATDSEKMAGTYGSNVMSFERPTKGVLDISSASDTDLAKLGVDKSTAKIYKDTLASKNPATIIGQKVDYQGGQYKIGRTVSLSGKEGVFYELHPTKYGEKNVYIPKLEAENIWKLKENLSNVKDAEDILMNNIIERFTGGKSVEELVNGGSSEAGKLKSAKEAASKWLNKQGYSFVKHQGGIRAGGGNELHDVYIALSDEALKPKTKSQLTDIWNKAHKTISKTVDPLISEAKKYKSAEEFINSFDKRYHQTSPEIASRIEKSGFSTNRGAASVGDIMPTGINSKYTTSEIGIPNKGSQVEIRFHKGSKILDFEDRDAVKRFLTNHSEGAKYKEITDKMSQLDREYGAKLNKLESEQEQFVNDSKKYNEYFDKQDVLLEEWKKTVDQLGDEASSEATRIFKQNGIDAINIKKDTGGAFGNKSTDNTILFNPDQIKTKSQLTDIWNQAQKVEPQLNISGQITTPKVNYKKVIEQNLGIRDKSPNTRILDSKIAKIEKKLTAPEKLNIQDQAKYDFQDWKDKQALSLTRETMERNIEDVAGKDAPAVKKYLVDPVRQNETARTNFVNGMRNDIKENIIKKYGIKPNSTEDALIQKFGEGRLTLDKLKQETSKWKQISESAAYFKDKYNAMLDMVNTQRAKFGYEPIPKRVDYFRHFQDIGSAIDQLGLILKQDALPTDIAGITDIFKPGKPFSTAEMARKGDKTKFSAIGGMDNYLESISKQIFHIDSVQRGRALEDAIRKEASLNPNIKLPNLVSNINEYTNLLSGKKGVMDRVGERFLGRGTYGVINWLKQRTGANMIGANLSSALTNFIPFTQSLATTSKPSALHGMMESMISPLKENFSDIGGQVSGFLTRRFPENKLSMNLLEKTSDKAGVLFKWIDQFTSKSIVAGKYYENISKGMNPAEAMKLADEYAGKVITDRSMGQLPVLFQQKTLGPIVQFQAEVNNMYSNIVKDIPRQYQGHAFKTVNALAQFVLFSYLYNNMAENIVGRRPTIDPIQAGLTLLGQTEVSKEQKPGERIVSAATDIGQNLPFASILTGGGRLPISAGLPDVAGVLSGKSTWAKEFQKPLSMIVPPFGGGQFKKTLEGIQAYNEGAIKNQAGNIQVPIEQNLQNRLRTTLFGKYSVPGTEKYFSNPHPLSDQQTQLFNQLPNNEQLDYFNFLQNERKANATQNDVHEKMRLLIEQGLKNNDDGLFRQAVQLDPGAFKKIFETAVKNQAMNQISPQDKVKLEMIKAGLNPFYTN